MAVKPLLIRKGKNGKLLLLACQAGRGKLALGRQPCDFENWHIAIKTQDFQHPHCIDFKLTNDRNSKTAADIDTKKYSRCYVVGGGVGTFIVQLRWTSGHSPYPEIETMEVWCFGIYMGNRAYPKASKDYTDVATVEVKETGQVLVNGMNAGFWPELLLIT